MSGDLADAAALRAAIGRGLSDDDDHERACRQTAAGEAAWRLRQEAHRIAARSPDDAIVRLRQAVALLDGHDEAVGMAAARHDLAKALLDARPTDGFAFGAALELLEHAVGSSARRRFPRRWAISASLLASSLRRVAMEEIDATRAALTFDRAEGLFLEAIKAAEGVAAMLDLAGYWLNLGNLRLHRDDEAAALAAFERGYAYAQPLSTVLAASGAPTFERLAAALGRLLLKRRRAGDLDRGRALLRLVAKSPGREGALAKLDLVRWYSEAAKPTKARGLMVAVSFHDLPWDALGVAVASCEELGLIDHMVDELKGLLDHYFRLRIGAVADLEADRVAEALQKVAAVLARCYLRSGRDLDAFLVRENVAGLRFNEATAANLASHAEPLTRALQAQFDRAGTTAGLLADCIDRLSVAPPETWRATLEATAAGHERTDPAVAPWAPAVAAAMRRALACEPLTLAAIDATLASATRRAAIARARLDERAGEDARRINEDVSRDELRRILREAPDTVLVQVTVAGKALTAIAVRLDDGELATRHLSIALPARLFAALRELEHKPSSASVAHELTELLEAIDLSPVLGERHYSLAVVLPSATMARLPLTAIGPRGRRLLDRCDTVIWLPNLFALRTRQAARPPRAGHLVVMPGLHGNTAWHSIAFAERAADEERLAGRAATREAVLRAAARVDTVAFYGHGSHVDGERALREGEDSESSIRLADDRLSSFDLDERWRGMERVELWGCQTGVHTSIDPMTAPIDEAFGFDYDFVRLGVRSAIGSLYKVPEILTAFLVADYRRRLREGASAPRALADAQRAWVDVRLPQLIADFREEPATALTRLAARHGVALDPRSPTNVDVAFHQAIWSCPLFWASFRFIGVAERRPIEPWDAAGDRPLTAAEQAQLDAWFADENGSPVG